MDFVTKKQFEDALLVIHKALNSGQIIYSRHEQERVNVLDIRFITDESDVYKSEELTLVPPLTAAREKMISLKNDIKKYKENVSVNQKVLDSLEVTEKKLIALIATLKE